jgi:hypothetical protein
MNPQKTVALLLCAALALPLGAVTTDTSFKISYDGGSLAGLKPGTSVRIAMNGERIWFIRDKEEIASIPVAAITELSYGQDVHRRVGAAVGLALISFGVGLIMLTSKSKKHFIGLTWDDNGKKGGIAFQADKSDYRGLLAGIEGVTGKKAVDSDTLTVKN